MSSILGPNGSPAQLIDTTDIRAKVVLGGTPLIYFKDPRVTAELTVAHMRDPQQLGSIILGLMVTNNALIREIIELKKAVGQTIEEELPKTEADPPAEDPSSDLS